MNSRRLIPSVDLILDSLDTNILPRPLIVQTVRNHLSGLRRAEDIPALEAITAAISRELHILARSRIQPVLNGTGVLVHTNLGRSPLGARTAQAMAEVARTYTNLEFDLDSGKRGNRAAYLEQSLALLCGAPAATVVNNCAAALVLILRHFCGDKRNEVVISRGELIQIGGGFRIPDVLESSGARLREVGTTNKTSIRDYERAIGKETGLLLKVHRSNFFMEGFVACPSTSELARLARKKRVPMVEDLGSGAMIDTSQFGPVDHEPTPQEALKQGADLVCFSGDKLLGGAQAGIIAGARRLVLMLKKEPFFRALRCDKLVLTALQETVDAYLRSQSQVTLVDMMAASCDELRIRGEKIVAGLANLPINATVNDSEARFGGGALPRSSLPSIAVALRPGRAGAKRLAKNLRAGDPPVVGYVERGTLLLDLRTIFPKQDEALIHAICASLQERDQ